MKTGLVMEGGAMRGMFTCGVIDVFMEHDIEFDGAAGISAGAVFGCNYKSRQPGRALRYNKEYCRDPRYCGIGSLLKTGNLYGVDFCYHEIPEVLDPFDYDAFRKNPMEFYVGAANVETGLIMYHKCSDCGRRDMLWMRASASLPLVSRVVEVDGLKLLDGGIVDPVPYRYMESIGYDRCVIILTQPRGYRKKKDPTIPLVRAKLIKYPKVATAMALRHYRYNEQMKDIDERERDGRVLVIRPPEPLGIGRTTKDPAELERVYQIGRREGAARLSEVTEFLSSGSFRCK